MFASLRAKKKEYVFNVPNPVQGVKFRNVFVRNRPVFIVFVLS